MKKHVEPVRLVDEEASRLAGAPGSVDHLVPNPASIELTGHLAAAWVDEIVLRPGLHRVHELVGDSNGNVEVRYLRQIFLAGDEVHDVGMIHAENSHVGATSRATLLDRIGRCIVKLHERHRPGRNARRRADHRALAPQLRESETGPATRLVDERHRAKSVVDPVASVGECVLDWQNEARRELAERPAGIHESR